MPQIVMQYRTKFSSYPIFTSFNYFIFIFKNESYFILFYINFSYGFFNTYKM